MLILHAYILKITGYRWNKYHRHNETWQYRWLNTTMANIKAETL